MRALRWERFYPNVEDNWARRDAGRPALVVELRQPTAKVWLQFRQAVLEDSALRQKFVELLGQYGEQGALRIVANHDQFGALLWLPCVGAVEWPADWMEGLTEAPNDGASLWALRDTLDSGALFSEVFDALLDRASLEAGLTVPLASGSGPSVVQSPDLEPAGVAASAATSSPS